MVERIVPKTPALVEREQKAIEDLRALFPDGNVAGLDSKDKALGKRLSKLYRSLGYESRADMIVACAGSARMIGPAHVRPETVLIDVGINADGDGICGDADYERISGIVSVITPVPGGVGSVTTSVLLKHVVESAERSAD